MGSSISNINVFVWATITLFIFAVAFQSKRSTFAISANGEYSKLSCHCQH